MTTTNDLITAYRNGDSAAAEELLIRFRPYILKWVHLLTYGKWDHKDREIKHFLGMMGCKDVMITAQLLPVRLKAYENVDIEQEVKVVFLEVALRTKSIRNNMKYALQKRVVALLKDPLVYNYKSNIQVDDSPNHFNPETQINSLWEEGFTAGVGFADLTVFERKIIRLTKWEGLTIEQAAKELKVSIATVNRAISRAKTTLGKYFSNRKS